MKLRVTQKAHIATDIVRVRMEAQDKSILPSFEPGAHIEINVAGFKRQYSLTSSPENYLYYEICVLRTENSRGGSAYIHTNLDVNDLIEISVPINSFPLNLTAEESVFIAGGIGITPFITMVNTLKKMGKPFELHYVARCVSRFLPINNYSEKIFLYNSRNEKHAMHVEQLLKGINRSAQIYVCGPLRLIEDVLNTTNKLGWSMQNVHFESFGATSKKADKTIAVKLMQSGISIEVNPGTSILNALLENNIWMPYECLRGECASCAVEVISGEIDHRDLCLTDEQRKHTMCPCVSWANSKNISINL